LAWLSEEHDRLVMALSGKFNALHPDQVDLLPDAHVALEPKHPLDRFRAAIQAAVDKLGKK
jgi:hypothetical protein